MSKLTELQRAEIVSWRESLPWWDEVFAATDAGDILLRVAKAAKNYQRASYMLKKAKYWYAKKRCSFLSIARVIDVLEEWSEELFNALGEARKAGLIP